MVSFITNPHYNKHVLSPSAFWYTEVPLYQSQTSTDKESRKEKTGNGIAKVAGSRRNWKMLTD